MADAGNSELARTLGIALIGPPCSGKSSVAARLVSQYQLCKLTTGDVIRAAAEDTGDVSTDPEARRYLAGVVKSGGLLPDAVVMQLLKQRLASPACRKGFVLDGFPRTESQAKDLQDVLKKSDSETEFHAVELKIEDRSTLSERMAGRLVHPGSGRTYHLVHDPPKELFKDDLTGDDLTRRSDDTKSTFDAKVKSWQSAETRSCLQYYFDAGTLWTVNGAKSAVDVAAAVRAALKSV